MSWYSWYHIADKCMYIDVFVFYLLCKFYNWSLASCVFLLGDANMTWLYMNLKNSGSWTKFTRGWCRQSRAICSCCCPWWINATATYGYGSTACSCWSSSRSSARVCGWGWRDHEATSREGGPSWRMDNWAEQEEGNRRSLQRHMGMKQDQKESLVWPWQVADDHIILIYMLNAKCALLFFLSVISLWSTSIWSWGVTMVMFAERNFS